MPRAAPPPPANRLLALLPPAEVKRIGPHLAPVELKFKQVIYKAQQTIEYVYFPTRGVGSAVSYVGDGTAIEVATVGDEGMFGLPALLGEAESPNDLFIQIPGAALRMPAAALRRVSTAGGPIYQVLVKYLNAYLLQVSQAVACNGLHKVRQRCCRWLLMTHDRVHADALPLTHEFLAIMLGVRRAGVSEVLGDLQEAGLIRSGRGVITVLDRPGLEEQACLCYHVVANEYERLLA